MHPSGGIADASIPGKALLPWAPRAGSKERGSKDGVQRRWRGGQRHGLDAARLFIVPCGATAKQPPLFAPSCSRPKAMRRTARGGDSYDAVVREP